MASCIPGILPLRLKGHWPRAMKKKDARISPGALGTSWLKVYFMPDPLLVLADFAFGSMLRIPSVADTATTDPSRPVPTTGK